MSVTEAKILFPDSPLGFVITIPMYADEKTVQSLLPIATSPGAVHFASL